MTQVPGCARGSDEWPDCHDYHHAIFFTDKNQTGPRKKKATGESNGDGGKGNGQGGAETVRPHLHCLTGENAARMADGSDGTDVSPESEATAAAVKGGEIWGTLEELLLACAVTRHGTASWDSVAMEVQTRSPVAARSGLTPHSCRLRFRHLHRRFSTVGSGGEEAEAEAEEDPDASAAEGWVDELRRLRVAELRRDVERCDLSIGYVWNPERENSKQEKLPFENPRPFSLPFDGDRSVGILF